MLQILPSALRINLTCSESLENVSDNPFIFLRFFRQEVVTGKRTALSRSTPLTVSLTKLLDIVSNFMIESPGVNLKSNIFNVTTWMNLSNETWALILKSEKSWIHHYQNSAWYKFNMTSYVGIDYLVRSKRLFQLLESVIDLVSGGDIWQKLRNMYEISKLKPLLTLVENMPNLVITAADTFASSERLDDFIQKFLLGLVHPCNIDRYLIPPSYLRKKGLLTSIKNFCQKILMSDEQLTWINLLPLNGKYNVIFDRVEIHRKNGFAKVSKNLVRYRSENFVRLLK